MAAASSMTSNSAWPSFTASPGWMYCRSHECKSITPVAKRNVTQQEAFLRYLDGLSVLFEDVHPHHRFVELRIQRLDDFIVQMLLRVQKN